MKTLSKKTPNRRTALVQAYEREGSHGGDWVTVKVDTTPEGCTIVQETCVVDHWDLWDDCTPPALRVTTSC